MAFDKDTLLYAVVGVAALSWLWRRSAKDPIPALLGSRGLVSSYIGAFQFFTQAKHIVSRGYYEYRGGVVRVPHLLRWEYVAFGPKRMADVAAASDDVLSFQGGAEDPNLRQILQADYTMSHEITANPYHAHTVRTALTRNIARCLPQMHDEFVRAFEDEFALDGTEWKEITMWPHALQVVARTTARVFVGLPLCRNQEYVDLSISYTLAVFGRAQIIAMFPSFLKPIFGRLLSSRRSSLRQAMKTLGPVIDERLAKDAELGPDWADRPNDFISWLIDAAEGPERTAPAIALRILATNTAAIHTSSSALTAALYNLTTYPKHIGPMREEAERVIAAEGWTKTALGNMIKIDSFLRESQRFGSGAVSMLRKVVAKDGFVFGDGTVLPQGAFVSVASHPASMDPANYENAEVFDGFRFARERDEAGEGSSGFTHHMVSTGAAHLVFGHGKHACPGRFFAAAELKAMLAHLLLNYDFKAQTEGVRPKDFAFGVFNGPDPRGRVWIRRRVREDARLRGKRIPSLAIDVIGLGNLVYESHILALHETGISNGSGHQEDQRRGTQQQNGTLQRHSCGIQRAGYSGNRPTTSAEGLALDWAPNEHFSESGAGALIAEFEKASDRRNFRPDNTNGVKCGK
ncbi:cytochrome P450 [Mycena haematopus]|nr:cytochrome P450 [Mycena haematopus]